MAYWCLRDIRYDSVDFLSNPSLTSLPICKCVGHKTDSKSSCDASSRDPDSDDNDVVETGSGEVVLCIAHRLRAAILNRDERHTIAHLVSIWPHDNLRLIDVILPEECDRVFDGQTTQSSVDYLWLSILRGLVLMTTQSFTSCRLRRIDLTGFVPTKALAFTFLNLAPFIALGSREATTARCIYEVVMTTLPSGDSCLEENVLKLIDIAVNHPVFTRGHKVQFPQGQLDIVIDFLPVSASALPFLCFSIATAISHVTKVYVTARSFVYTHVERCIVRSERFTVDPVTPLRAVTRVQPINTVSGLSLKGLPADRIASVLGDVFSSRSAFGVGDGRCQDQMELGESVIDSYQLRKLSITDCHTDLCRPSHADSLLYVLVRCRSIVRLDLSGTLLDGKLQVVLAVLANTIEYLCLSDCRLELDDIDNLLSSSNCQTLRDLDLSYIYSTHCVDCGATARPEKKLRRWVGCGVHQKLYSDNDSDNTLVTGNINDQTIDGDVEEDSGLSASSRVSTLIGSSSQLSDFTGSNDTCEDSDCETETNSFSTETCDETQSRPLSSASTTPTCRERSQEGDVGRMSSRRGCIVHEEDRDLVSHLIRSFAATTDASTLDCLTILDVANDCFDFRLPDREFAAVVDTLKRMHRLRHLSVESFPLWDNDIVTLVENIASAGSRPTLLQSLAVTRSVDAPHCDFIGRSAFWKRLEAAKRGRRIRLSIENYIGN